MWIIIDTTRIDSRNNKTIRQIRTQLFYHNSRTVARSRRKRPVSNRHLIDRASTAITVATAAIANTEVRRREEIVIIITILVNIKIGIPRIIRETWMILVKDRKTRIILEDSRLQNTCCRCVIAIWQSLILWNALRFWTYENLNIIPTIRLINNEWSMFSSLVLINHDVHI